MERPGPAWPSSVLYILPVLVFQSLTVWSEDPDATNVPSGENATEATKPEWPF
jgi:hypothetical protein